MKNYIWSQIWSRLTVLYSLNLVDLNVLVYNFKTVMATILGLASFKKIIKIYISINIHAIFILSYVAKIIFRISKFAISYYNFFHFSRFKQLQLKNFL